jgi:hypothetical protein
MAGALLTCAAAIALVLVASEHSDAVAARERARSDAQPPMPATPATPAPPQLKASNDDPEHLYRTLAIATLDPVETCARGARGVVMAALGHEAIRERDGERYFEPSDELMRTADEAGKRAAATCGGDRWPEIYVLCEGTLADIREGIINCYPYDIFAGTDLPIERDERPPFVLTWTRGAWKLTDPDDA